MELTINGKVYKFKAGIGFMRKANKKIKQKVESSDAYRETGLRYLIAGLFDGEVEDLIDTLDYMNEGMEPRITREEIELYIEDEATDIDSLFESVLDFLSNANVSKKVYKEIKKEVDRLKKKAEKEAD